MKIKSYYLTKKNIVVKDFDNNTNVLTLNRENLMNMINILDEQIGYSIDEITESENKAYQKLITGLGIAFLFEMFFAYLVFSGFTNASYTSMIVGIIASLILVLTSIIMIIVGSFKIRFYTKQYKIYEGREILIQKYNSLISEVEPELVDVY